MTEVEAETSPSLGPARWLARVIRWRFDFGKQVAMRLAEQLGATPPRPSTGSGPLASGTTLALIMSMAGRQTYCDELGGDGSATLPMILIGDLVPGLYLYSRLPSTEYANQLLSPTVERDRGRELRH